jgi:hypothetical protein
MGEIFHGFGVPNDVAPHRFLVRVPQGRGGTVELIEDYGAAGVASGLGSICRVRVPRATWRAVADEAKAYLNRRLREKKVPASRFTPGETPVERLLGRELCVLAWAVEEMSPEEAAAAVPKWASYRPEELWWIFAQVDRDAGEFDDQPTGWRAGIRLAFAPASAPAVERRKRRRTVDRSHTPDLFSTFGGES